MTSVDSVLGLHSIFATAYASHFAAYLALNSLDTVGSELLGVSGGQHYTVGAWGAFTFSFTANIFRHIYKYI